MSPVKKFTVRNKFPAALKKIGKLEDEDIEAFMEVFALFAKEEVPVDIGDLKGSIDFEKIKEAAYRLFTTMGYGAYVELGTVLQEANPYMRRAFKRAVDRFFTAGKRKKGRPT